MISLQKTYIREDWSRYRNVCLNTDLGYVRLVSIGVRRYSSTENKYSRELGIALINIR